MRVLHVAAEAYPLLKTGGLADVVAALPAAQRARGGHVRVLLPGFPAMLAGVADLRTVASLGPAFGAGRIDLLLGSMPDSGVPVYVIDAPFLYDRPGNPYLAPDGGNWADNHLRFALLGWTAAQLAGGRLDPDWQAQVLHCHDWHAALAPAYLAARPGPRPPTVFTIHNLAYQGLFDASVFSSLALPQHFFHLSGLEFHGQVSFLKAGLVHAQRITTVSPTYAREILEAAQGEGLDGMIRQRAAVLSGILNGVDPQVWNPATDLALTANYTQDDRAGKARCKADLQAKLGLDVEPGAALLAVVSRLTHQKGLDLVLDSLDAILAQGAQLAVLGSGDPHLEQAFAGACRAHAGRVAVHLGYDELLAHRMVAGADLLLVPSRFEPCGLTQLYALRYGTLPLVRRVGGLADTVVDAEADAMASGRATGFVFEPATVAGFQHALQRSLEAWRHPALWQRLIGQAMAQDFSWTGAASQYDLLYQEVCRA